LNGPQPQLQDLTIEQKRALAAGLLREKAGREASAWPLSQGQQALWFLHRLAPESAAYHLHFTARIRSRFDTAAFERACAGLLARHSALQTVVVERAAGLTQ